VRATAWVDGGVAVWERPQIEVAIEPLGRDRVRVELVDLRLRRPEHLPAALRERSFAERVLGWSLADVAAPTQPWFWAVRAGGRGELELVAEVPRASAMILACEDVCGHRHVRRLDVPRGRAGVGAAKRATSRR
jgi:hypothetical protein